MNPLLIQRRGMMAGKALPYDAEVEYLQSSGNCYIDTGITAGNTLQIELKMLHRNTQNNTSYGFFFGSRVANNNKQYGLLETYIGNYRYGNSQSSSYVMQNDTIVLFTNTDQVNNMKVYDDNNVLLTTLSTNTSIFDNGLKAGLFGCNTSGTYNYGSSITIYSLKMYKSSTLVRDFIPVRVGTVGYMYDRVSVQLFGNMGTGNFILGPDIQ